MQNVLARATLKRLLSSNSMNLRGLERDTGVAYSVLLKIREDRGEIYYSTAETLSAYFLAPFEKEKPRGGAANGRATAESQPTQQR